MKADSEKVTRLLKTAHGQMNGILKMVDEDKYCLDISHQIMACQAILKKANSEIIRAHMHSCVQEAFESGSEQERNAKIDELTELFLKS